MKKSQEKKSQDIHVFFSVNFIGTQVDINFPGQKVSKKSAPKSQDTLNF
jgi:hypothetical protein